MLHNFIVSKALFTRKVCVCVIIQYQEVVCSHIHV